MNYGTCGMIWRQPERPSSDVRYACRMERRLRGVGCVITRWKEGPQGLRPVEGKGPGEGWSSAIADLDLGEILRPPANCRAKRGRPSGPLGSFPASGIHPEGQSPLPGARPAGLGALVFRKRAISLTFQLKSTSPPIWPVSEPV